MNYIENLGGLAFSFTPLGSAVCHAGVPDAVPGGVPTNNLPRQWHNTGTWNTILITVLYIKPEQEEQEEE